MNRAVEVRTPSDGFAATFPKGDGFYPDKLKFIAQLTSRALSLQLSTVTSGIGVALRPARVVSFQSSTVNPGIGVALKIYTSEAEKNKPSATKTPGQLTAS